MLQRYGLLYLWTSPKTCFLTSVFEHSPLFSPFFTFFVKNCIKSAPFLSKQGEVSGSSRSLPFLLLLTFSFLHHTSHARGRSECCQKRCECSYYDLHHNLQCSLPFHIIYNLQFIIFFYLTQISPHRPFWANETNETNSHNWNNLVH